MGRFRMTHHTAVGESEKVEKLPEQAITERQLMSAQQPIYNSRVTKSYIDYLRTNFPQIHINSVLKMAGIAEYEIEDSAHWFTQEQLNKFHKSLRQRTRILRGNLYSRVRGQPRLRLSAQTLDTLRELDIRHIAQLQVLPRASRAARVGDEVAKRLDQATRCASQGVGG